MHTYTDQDIQTIKEVLAPYLLASHGTHTSFKDVPYEILEKLDKDIGLDKEDQQNDAPTLEEFMNVMRDTGAKAHGYIISNRDDQRITIEGIDWEGPYKTQKGMKTMARLAVFLCRADSFDMQVKEDTMSIYSWWD